MTLSGNNDGLQSGSVSAKIILADFKELMVMNKRIQPALWALLIVSALPAFAGVYPNDPYPPDVAQSISTNVTLTWTNADYVAPYNPERGGNGHHLFIHTDRTKVENGNIMSALGATYGHYRSDFNDWYPTEPNFGMGGELTKDTTYYWRIIDVNKANPASPWASNIWSFATLGAKASGPNPSDGAYAAPLNSVLSWTPGVRIAYSPNGGHDVYFGSDRAAVLAATTANPLGVYKGRQDPNLYNLGTFALFTRYYWRIDEVNNASGIVTGDIWAFKTRGTAASNPSPAYGAVIGELINPAVDVTLSWAAGAYAADVNGHDVYFGTSESDVNNASIASPLGVYKGRQTTTSQQQTALTLDVTYFWRIDEVNLPAVWKGPLWKFSTDSGKAKNPFPANASPAASTEAVLTWTSGYAASSHDIYFGTANPPPFVANQTATKYDPNTLAPRTTYFWRIDERNALGTKQGDSWSFTTSAFGRIYPGQVGVNTGPQFVDLAKELTNYADTSGNSLTASDLDTNGWPEKDFQMFFDLRLVAEWDSPPHIDDPQQYRTNYGGTHKCSFTGQATVYIVWGSASVQNVSYNSPTNTTTFNLVLPAPAPGQMFILRFSNTKRTPASPSGSGITNLRIIRPGYLLDTAQVFTNAFLNAFGSADWACWRMATSDAHTYPDTQEWSERKLPTDCPAAWTIGQGKLESLPWEYVIEMSNITGVRPWVSVPVSATDDYIIQLAYFLKDNLDGDLDFYLELSNEVWNTGFSCGVWNAAEAAALGMQANRNYARRVINMAKLFEEVFGPGSLHNRVKVILAGQHVCLSGCSPNNTYDMLNYINSTFGPPKNWIYALATTGYFEAGAVTQTGTIDQLLDACIANINSDLSLRQQWVNTAKSWNLPGLSVAYEAGYSTPAGGSITNLDNQILMHRVSRAYDVLKYNHDDGFLALGATMLNQFTLYGAYTRYGAWGATDDVSIPDRNYKLQAVRQVIGNLTVDLNNDNTVDFADFSIMADQWGSSGSADLNGDGIVDSADLLKLALDWLWCE